MLWALYSPVSGLIHESRGVLNTRRTFVPLTLYCSQSCHMARISPM